MKPADDLRTQLIRSMTFAMSVGLELACVLLIFVLLGHYLDTRFQSSPWGLLVGIILGVGGGRVAGVPDGVAGAEVTKWAEIEHTARAKYWDDALRENDKVLSSSRDPYRTFTLPSHPSPTLRPRVE